MHISALHIPSATSSAPSTSFNPQAARHEPRKKPKIQVLAGVLWQAFSSFPCCGRHSAPSQAVEPGVEGGQPGTREKAPAAHQDSPCKSSNSNCSSLCLVWKKLQEGRASSLLFFSAPQATSLPKLAASLSAQAGPGHSTTPAL